MGLTLLQIRRAVALCAMVALTTTCIDEHDTDAVTASSVKLDDFPQAVARAFCGVALRCDNLGLWALDVATCTAFVRQNLHLAIADIGAVKAKRRIYDAVQARKCVIAIEALSCAHATSTVPTACNSVTTGVAKNGAACDGHDLCASGFCKRDPGATCGVCAAALKVGSACGSGGGCVAGSACLTGVCTAIPQSDGAACESHAHCNPASWCATTAAGGMGVCTKVDTTKGQCTKEVACPVGQVCTPAAAKDGPGTCVAGLALGAVCDHLDDFEDGKRSTCGGDSVCGLPLDANAKDPVCVSRKKAGQACTSHWQCGAIDGFCINGKCGPPPAVGKTCLKWTFGSVCAVGAFCDSTQVCAPVGGIGVGCADEKQCDFGSHCVGGVCLGPAGSGQKCDQIPVGRGCLDGLVCGGGGVCGVAGVCGSP